MSRQYPSRARRTPVPSARHGGWFAAARLAWAAATAGALTALGGLTAPAALTGLAAVMPAPAVAQTAAVNDTLIIEAREAWRLRDRQRLTSARDGLIATAHPLAPWADYWLYLLRQSEISPVEVDAFLARWPDAYVADRARNDWLLELGRRRDWSTFVRIQPAFRMNDDREVLCLGLLARQQLGIPLEGGDLREQARQAWWTQKDPDQGCDAMAQTLLAAGVLTQADVWVKLRLALEADKFKTVQQSARMLGEPLAQAVARVISQPAALLMPAAAGTGGGAARGSEAPGAVMGAPGTPARKAPVSKARARNRPAPQPIPLALPEPIEAQLNLLAFIRWAGTDTTAAAAAIQDNTARQRWHWQPEEAGWAWAQLGRSAAWRLNPEAPSYFQRALTDRGLALGAGGRIPVSWSPETLAWMARAALRAASAGQPAAWAQLEQALDAMAPEQQADPAWAYWRAKALQARAAQATAEPARKELRERARAQLQRVVHPLTFYGQLAAEELHGTPARAPATPAPFTEVELAQARAMPGTDRALRLFDLGWRGEAVREWNYTLTWGKPGGMADRDILTMAELACQREIWDRCINGSERTRNEVSLAQRYPTPFRQDIVSAARDVGLDPAYMLGLIRQESRFLVAARSHVGASGLMQVMPATAAWTARKLDIAYQSDLLTDRQTNLRIGAGYLKLVLDDFQGMQALAAAAYNAGPGRPRRWREGPRTEAAAWVENIPFTETRDYVKKVLSNAVVYAHLLHGKPLSLRERLGATVGPRAGTAPPSATDLP
jgi:soluble lytic murein transglycosylase